VEDAHHRAKGYGDSYLRLHHIETTAKAGFDTQVPFDPFEKKFDLPSRLVELEHNESRDLQMIGKVDQMLGSLLKEPLIKSHEDH
jgi:hypothetical protein